MKKPSVEFYIAVRDLVACFERVWKEVVVEARAQRNSPKVIAGIRSRLEANSASEETIVQRISDWKNAETSEALLLGNLKNSLELVRNYLGPQVKDDLCEEFREVPEEEYAAAVNFFKAIADITKKRIGFNVNGLKNISEVIEEIAGLRGDSKALSVSESLWNFKLDKGSKDRNETKYYKAVGSFVDVLRQVQIADPEPREYLRR